MLAFFAGWLAAMPAWSASQTLVPAGAIWKYNDTGTDLGTAWRGPGYVDSGWAAGPARLGYGDGDEATAITSSPVRSCYYFRHTFNVANPAAYTSLSLEVLRDDGAVVYLNGQEVARYNMPAGTITYAIWASSASEYSWDPPQAISNLLVAGDNVIAVEVHQGNSTSTDVSLDLSLTGISEITVNLDSPPAGATDVPIPATLSATATDPEGQPLTVNFYGRTAPPPVPDFTIVVLPDTQYYTDEINGGTKEMFVSQTQWIVTNRAARNIVYVAHLGDVSNNGDRYLDEWLNATEALYLLEDPLTTLLTDGIPYGTAVGNHDQLNPGADLDPGPTTYYNQYFGVSNFEGRSYYGGHYGNNNNNHYDLFSASGLDFIVIYFEYDTTPDQAVLDWADAVLKAHPSRRGIVVSHYLIETTAAWGVQGQAIYNALADNPNLFLMLCGHNHGEAQRTDVYANNTVYTLLSDYQSYANGGNGFLRIMTFSPNNNCIFVETYSPWLTQYETDAASQFTLSYPMQSGPAFELVQQNTDVPSGTQTSATWSGLQAGTDYEWFVEATDGVETKTTEARWFTTSVNTPPTVAINYPAEDASFPDAPASVPITATASDSDGAVSSVEFFANSTSVGVDSTSPYEVTANLSTDSYTLTVVATDDGGAQTVSDPVHVTVGVPPTAPSGLSAAAQSRTEILLTWSDQSLNESDFSIHRSLDGVNYASIGTVGANGTSALITELQPATTYYFIVRAFNGVGYGDSAPASATTTANFAPNAADDAYAANEDTALTILALGVLGNDTDANGDPLAALLGTEPVNGTVSFNAEGSFTYTPAVNFSGVDSFTYQATDGYASSDPATVTITVNAVNDLPVANPDAASTLQGTAVLIVVLANDTDVDGQGLDVTAVTQGASGIVTLNADNTVTYRPNAGFTGQDVFTYTVSDGEGTADGTVTVTVNPNILFSDGFESGNFTVGGWVVSGAIAVDPSAAFAGAYGALLKKTSVMTKSLYGIGPGTVTLSYARRTASLEAGDSGTVESSSDGQNWVLVENVSGTTAWEMKTFELTLAAPDLHLRFRVNGNEGNDAFMVDEVVLKGGAANGAPVAGADAYSVEEDATLTVAAPGVLGNDTDPESDPLGAELVSGTSSGSLTLNADGSFTYTPSGNFNGPDSFTYQATDGLADSPAATVSITVTAVNDAPVANAQSVTVTEDESVMITLTGSDVDGDVLTYTVVTSPVNGTLSGAAPNLTYTPAPNYHESDSFTFTVSDGTLTSGQATVGITVTRVNKVPVAVADSYTTDEDIALTVAAPGLLGNDSDEDGDPLTAVLISGPANGILSLNANGSFSYTPAANWNGTDSFTYKANDGLADSPPATVTITVTAVNDAPKADADAYTMEQGTTLTVAAPGVLGNDSDVDGDALSTTFHTDPANGIVRLNDNGSFSYTPDAGFTGPDSFTYTASDGNGGAASGTVTITVQAPATSTMHVDSIVVLSQDLGRGLKRGYAEVVVVDASGAPVAGAGVTGTFSEDIQETLSSTTGTDGRAVFQTTGTVAGRCHLTFCVDGVTLTGWIYDSAANVETCDKNH